MDIKEQLAKNGRVQAYFEAQSMPHDARGAFLIDLEHSIAEHALLSLLEGLTPEKRKELLKIPKSNNDQAKLLSALKSDVKVYKEAFTHAILKEVGDLAF